MIPDDLSQDIPNGNVPQNAVSIYGQNDTADDFPVLKAFQEYVNAEQEKARKRLMTICTFFGIFLFLVVAVFVFLLWDSGRRKDQLYDRLISSIEERSRVSAQVAAPTPVVVQTPAAAPAPTPGPSQNAEQAAALKAVADALAELRRDVEEQKKRDAVEKSPSQLAVEKRNREDTDKLLRERAKLDTERRRLADEKERLRQAEVERQRRRLYPDYYDADGKPKSPTKRTEESQQKKAAAKPTYSDKDIQDILIEADRDAVEYFSEEEKPKKSEKAAKSAPKRGAKDADDEQDDPSYYGKDYKLPIKDGKKSSSWDIPLEDADR